jgi:hypothetical protein
MKTKRPIVKVSKLDVPYASGDWHDPPIKWKVTGPDAERQDFSTKKDATKYARIRRNSPDAKTAENEYVKGYAG